MRPEEGEEKNQNASADGSIPNSSLSRTRELFSPLLTRIILLIAPLLYFYQALMGRLVLAPGDGWAQNFGVRALAAQLIREGSPPIWNAYIFGGMPLMASVYGGAIYPPNWLFVLFPPGWAMNLVVITTYHLALIGTYLYARRVGINRLGALLAGIAFTFGGFMINHLAQTSRIAAAAWLPWVLLAIENLAAASTIRSAVKWTALGALFIALQFFAGEPQMMVFTALVSAPVAVTALVRIPSRTARFRFLLLAGLMVFCAVLFCLIELLPARELLSFSERNDPGPLFFDSYSFPPWQLPGLIFPYFFGGAMFPPYRTAYWGVEIPAIMAGYVGALTWLLALTALLSGRSIGVKKKIYPHEERQIWAPSTHRAPWYSFVDQIPFLKVFRRLDSEAEMERNPDWPRICLWFGVAIFSLTLAFGGYLPFEINHYLYRIPGYSVFRGLYRHQFEFTFAIAMLAGFGVNRLAGADARSVLRRGLIATAALVTATALSYRLIGDRLATIIPRPAGAASVLAPEFLIPIAFYLLSAAALWFAVRSNFRSIVAGLFLIITLLCDQASYGHFFHFPIANFDVNERLKDPPAVQLIKSRETDWSSFRVMSLPLQPYDYVQNWPEDPNFEAINQPNISILRGLQSVSGYDILRPVRVGEISGSAGSAINGFVQDYKSFGLQDRGLDLLNLKYLILGHGGATKGKYGFTYDGVYFARTNFSVQFLPGLKLTTEAGGAPATEIAIVSTLANSVHLQQGTPILKLRLHTRDGRAIETQLEAGTHTSEHAFDRPDLQGAIKHARAPIVEDIPRGDYTGHHYLGRLKFDPAEIESIDWIYAPEDATLYVIRASLYDARTGVSTPLASFGFPHERWKRLGRFDQVEVLENQNLTPRAWFVDRLRVASSADTLKSIQAGQTPDGQVFDPLKVALVEEEIAQPAADQTGQASAKITAYKSDRIDLLTDNPGNGFLVFSEIFYPGWTARIDGAPAKIHRTDYTLRGVEIPAGQHKVEMLYRPATFRNGLFGALLGVLLLGLAYPISRKLSIQKSGEV